MFVKPYWSKKCYLLGKKSETNQRLRPMKHHLFSVIFLSILTSFSYHHSVITHWINTHYYSSFKLSLHLPLTQMSPFLYKHQHFSYYFTYIVLVSIFKKILHSVNTFIDALWRRQNVKSYLTNLNRFTFAFRSVPTIALLTCVSFMEIFFYTVQYELYIKWQDYYWQL